jgi:hypothetical protein
VFGEVTVVDRRGLERSSTRRRLTLMAAVTFVLLAACALVSLSPTPSGFRTPAAGAAGLHRSSGRVVGDVVSAQTFQAGRGRPDPGAITPSHHDARPTNGTTKNGSSTVHTVFTQAGVERRDAIASANLYKDVPSAFGDQVLSDPNVETTNTSITAVDSKVQLFFGNICSARVHQFTSSL